MSVFFFDTGELGHDNKLQETALNNGISDPGRFEHNCHHLSPFPIPGFDCSYFRGLSLLHTELRLRIRFRNTTGTIVISSAVVCNTLLVDYSNMRDINDLSDWTLHRF